MYRCLRKEDDDCVTWSKKWRFRLKTWSERLLDLTSNKEVAKDFSKRRIFINGIE